MTFKVVILGEGRVGKTSLGRRWAEDRFDLTTRSTIAAAFFQKVVTTQDNRSINIVLWDTAGQEEYHSLAPIYYKDAQAAVLVFSVADLVSFDRIVQWRNEVISARGPNIKLVVVGNKIDLKSRVVSAERGIAFAAENRTEYFEVSAKTGQGVDLLFSHLAETLSKIPAVPNPASKRATRIGIQVVELEEPPEPEKSCC